MPCSGSETWRLLDWRSPLQRLWSSRARAPRIWRLSLAAHNATSAATAAGLNALRPLRGTQKLGACGCITLKRDHSEGVRGYILPVMEALRCHQDVQMAGGRGLLLSYVTKYVAKWSDSSYDEWMADSASATSLCRKVLFEYHPMEPEMVLQLCGAQFRQWDFGSAGGGRRSVRAPRPGNSEQPPIVDLYLRSSWRRDSMSLLEFLRKSDAAGKTGDVAAWLRRKWKAEVRGLPEDARPSLEDFANEYVMQGEQLVAVEYLWRLNDVFYGQWCMMNLPFRSLDVFDLPTVRERVPARYRWLATALLLTDDPAVAPPRLLGYWRDPARIARDLQLEGNNDGYVQDMQAFVAGHAVAVDRYMSGHLNAAEEASKQASGGVLDGGEALELDPKQKILYEAVAARAALSMRAQCAKAEAEGDELREGAREASHRPIICSGRPGTGKSTVLRKNVVDALEEGAAVLMTAPTGRLSTRLASKLGAREGLVVDTAAAAFQFHKPAQGGRLRRLRLRSCGCGRVLPAQRGRVRAHLEAVGARRLPARARVLGRQVPAAWRVSASPVGEPGLEAAEVHRADQRPSAATTRATWRR